MKGNELKPAAEAYKRVAGWLIGSRVKACDVGQQHTWSCEFQSAEKPSFWIVWNPEQKLDFSLPVDWHVAEWAKLSGSLGHLGQNQKIAIGPVPTLLTK